MLRDTYFNNGHAVVVKPDADVGHRWSLCYDRYGGKVTTYVGLKLSDIKDTVTAARAAGDVSSIHSNVKAWMLKHVIANLNEGGVGAKPLAERVVITDNKSG
jgi:hypothetical protein